MPTYQTPLRGVAHSVAYAEAAAIAPIKRAMLWAFEMWHPSLADDGPIYIVNDKVDLVARIEATADRNGGTYQTFVACQVAETRDEESDASASPEITLAREGVSGMMNDVFKRSRGSLVPWVIIERIYASDDLAGPASLPPAEYELSGNTIAGISAGIKASYGDHANVSIPRLTFRREQYSGL